MSSTERHHGPASFDGIPLNDPSIRPAWYAEHISTLPSEGRVLLENYSKVSADNVLSHVLSIRDRAFPIFPYACIGQVRFLSFTLPQHPYWAEVRQRLSQGAAFLDAGCCFGQELRFLRSNEEVPAAQLHGFDLEPTFIELGYELFCDKDTLGATMLAGDLFSAKSNDLAMLDASMDIVHAASVLHSWAWDDMIVAAKRLIAFTKPQAGSMVIGNQMGSLDAGEYPMPTGKGVNYRHNVESIRRFWCQIGEETGTHWEIEAGMYLPAVVKENQQHSWATADPRMRMIWFSATRLSNVYKKGDAEIESKVLHGG